jgi:hypothetical protein
MTNPNVAKSQNRDVIIIGSGVGGATVGSAGEMLKGRRIIVNLHDCNLD